MSADSTTFGSFSQQVGVEPVWSNDERRRKLDQLSHHAQRPGSISLVSAAPGNGKSLTAHWLFQQFNLEDFEVLLLRLHAANTSEAHPKSPFWRILTHYFCPTAQEPVDGAARRAKLLKHLDGLAKSGRRLALLLDLQDSRLPTELAHDLEQFLEHRQVFEASVAIVIFCEPEQRPTLQSRPTLSDRIGFEWHIPPLDENETIEYLAQGSLRLGLARHFFSERAMQIIHQYSNGIYTRINTIADACLVESRRQNLSAATPEIVSDVCSSLSFRGRNTMGTHQQKSPTEFSKPDASHSHSQTQIAPLRPDNSLRLPKLSPLSSLLLDEEAS